MIDLTFVPCLRQCVERDLHSVQTIERAQLISLLNAAEELELHKNPQTCPEEDHCGQCPECIMLAMSSELDAALKRVAELYMEKVAVLRAANDTQDFDNENMVPVCNCCGFELNNDGTGHRSGCLAYAVFEALKGGAR